MAETKIIGVVRIVTDSETPYDHIGDVDGGFDGLDLKKHIMNHGHQGLCEKLASMSWQVWNTLREVNAEKDKQQMGVNANIG